MPAGKSQPSVATKAVQNLGAKNKQIWSGAHGCVALVILALFVLPIMAGNYLAKIWRMPDHAWKMSLVIGTFAVSILICCVRRIQVGS